MGIGGFAAYTKRRGDFSHLRCQPPSPPHSYQPSPPPSFSTKVSKTIFLTVAVGLIYLLVRQSPAIRISLSSSSPGDESSSSSFHVFKSDYQLQLPQMNNKQEDGNKLESILKRASMKDEKTVIITSVNAAWMEPSSIFDLFMESMRAGNQTQKFLDNLVVVAFDQEAYSRCSSLHRHCFALTTDGVDFSGAAHFTSGDYLKMMWRRIDFLGSVLEMGYNFVFSDADIAWMRDPFERFYKDGDIQFTCNVYVNNSTSRWNYPNAGFLYVKSNHRSIEFFRYWYAKREAFPGKNERDVLNMIKFNSFIDDIGLDIRFLDTVYYGGCEASEDLDVVVTMHVNCCPKLENKIHELKMVIADWKKYKDGWNSSRSWTVPRQCRWGESTVRSMKVKAAAAAA